MEEQLSVNPIPAYNLLLEFVKFTNTNKDNLSTYFTQLLTTAGLEIQQQNSTINDSSPGLQIFYFLNNSSYFSFISQTEQQTCHITFYLQYIDGKAIPTSEIIKKAEIQLCNKFGWENCIGSQIYTVGGGNLDQTSYLLNEDAYKFVLFKNMKMLHGEQTNFQKLRVFNTADKFGKVLVLDNFVQITDDSEDNYTVDLARKVVKKNQDYNHILFIGAGDLKIPTHVLENPRVKKVTVCEIDNRVDKVVRQFFKFKAKFLEEQINNGRLNMVYEDGSKFVKDEIAKGSKYDGIIIDNTDVDLRQATEDVIARVLFSVDFYKSLLALLSKGAAFSTQLTEEKNKDPWVQRAKDAGFQKIKFISCYTPEYSLDTPMGYARNI